MRSSDTATCRRRRVVILGLRGVPDVQGGIEAHVTALSTGLVGRGWDVEVLGRSPYLPPGGSRTWNGVVLTPLWAPRSKYLETLVHTAYGLVIAAGRAPDVVHIHAIGPALLTPLARLLGLRVVVTHHGFDYRREKWNALARSVLRLGERVGMGWAHGRIGVSPLIADTVRTACAVGCVFIPNGVEIRRPREGTTFLDAHALSPGRYVLLVARIVEEKRQLDLIAAFARLADPTLKLVVVGGREHGGDYLRRVEAAATATPNVVMTGFQTGEALSQLFANAALFVLPSSHEGMPIALLEALGHGLPVLASDIDAHLALNLDRRDYVPLGDVERLAEAMREKLAAPRGAEEAEAQRARIADTFGWGPVVDRTLDVYEAAARPRPPAPRTAPPRAHTGLHGMSCPDR